MSILATRRGRSRCPRGPMSSASRSRSSSSSAIDAPFPRAEPSRSTSASPSAHSARSSKALRVTWRLRAAAGLGVAITSATQVSGYDTGYTISGTTTTQGGVRSLVVNGVPITPAPDGSWSARLQLAPGANPLSAIVTDNSGDSTSAAGSVTFAPGPAQSALLKGSVRRGVLSATVRCQTLPGATCSGKLKLTARVTRVKRTRHGRRRSTKTITLATRSFKLAPGDRAVPTVRLGEGDAQARPQVPHQARDADAHADGGRRDEDDAVERAGGVVGTRWETDIRPPSAVCPASLGDGYQTAFGGLSRLAGRRISDRLRRSVPPRWETDIRPPSAVCPAGGPYI